MFILVWIVFFGLTFLFFSYNQKDHGGIVATQNGKVTIKADKQGHYWLSGLINEQPVKFIIDTGSTYVAIPKGLADKLQLTAYYPISADTANGKVDGYLTRIKQLNFANFNMQDVKAIIMPSDMDGTVLLGMNVLSLFELTQKEGDLVISKGK